MRMAVLSILFESPSKSEVVTTFMALLELMKKGRSLRKQKENYESIMLYPAVGDTEHDEIK